MTNTFQLNFQNITIAEFSIEKQKVIPIHWNYAPYSILNKQPIFETIQSWCNSRILLHNRKHYNNILQASKIDTESALDICIQSRGLSLTDCYWISGLYGRETWGTVNLFNNKFSPTISKTALTGEVINESISKYIKTLTGELTLKGIKAKCFMRDNYGTYLIKEETPEEMDAEEASYFINTLFGIQSTYYYRENIHNKNCIICKLHTNQNNHLISCRDVMDAYNAVEQSQVFDVFTQLGGIDFITMCIIDYICLNTDRNRDNYGFSAYGNQIYGFMPLFDHDSYFKGKSNDAIYFPTGKTFTETAEILKQHINNTAILQQRLNNFIITASSNTEINNKIKSLIDDNNYELMITRARELI